MLKESGSSWRWTPSRADPGDLPEESCTSLVQECATSEARRTRYASGHVATCTANQAESVAEQRAPAAQPSFRRSPPAQSWTRTVRQCISFMHGQDTGADRRRCRPRLPQLQPRLPGPAPSTRWSPSPRRRSRTSTGAGIRPSSPGRCIRKGFRSCPSRELEELVREHEVDEVVFAYSDVTHEHVMHIGSRALAAGASFRLISPRRHDARVDASRPSRSAPSAPAPGRARPRATSPRCSARPASGSPSFATRCPTATSTKQAVQRFEHYEDLDAADATIEEREEYEPHLAEGNLVFAGIDYGAILDRAEQEADVILWDGGNNDTPFVKPDLHIVVVDPHRPGHELPLPPGRDEPAHGRRLRRQQGRQRAAGGHRRRARLDPDAEPGAREIVLADSPFQVEGDAERDRGQARPRRSRTGRP